MANFVVKYLNISCNVCIISIHFYMVRIKYVVCFHCSSCVSWFYCTRISNETRCFCLYSMLMKTTYYDTVPVLVGIIKIHIGGNVQIKGCTGSRNIPLTYTADR